jgi:hypothetical protein
MSISKIHGQMSIFVLYSIWKIVPDRADCEIKSMSEEKKTGRKLTQARREANARYNSKFVEVKVRMTPEHRTVVQEHAASMDESTTAFINRAIEETMVRDQEKKSPQ